MNDGTTREIFVIQALTNVSRSSTTDRAMATDDERQERVLHARISESLERELKERARLLGLSVSNIVRNVLASSFGLVEDIVSDGADIARAVAGEAMAARPGG